MSEVLVTGAAGTLGTALVARLADRGHHVRALVRHRSADFPPAVQVARGDVRNPADLRQAVTGVDTVIHAATSPFRQAKVTEIEGTRAMLAAAESASAHVIYPSIVGVDRLSGTYYRAKWQAEQLVAAARNTTIQRATQLHPTLDKMLSHHLFPVTAHLAFQPLDPSDLAECLAGLVEAGRPAEPRTSAALRSSPCATWPPHGEPLPASAPCSSRSPLWALSGRWTPATISPPATPAGKSRGTSGCHGPPPCPGRRMREMQLPHLCLTVHPAGSWTAQAGCVFTVHLRWHRLCPGRGVTDWVEPGGLPKGGLDLSLFQENVNGGDPAASF